MNIICDLWPWLNSRGTFYFGGGGSPPPLIIPPPPPPPPPMPDIGSQQALEAQRAKLAAQLRTGRTSTDLTGSQDELRGGRGGLGAANPGATPGQPPAPGGRGRGGGLGFPPILGNPGAPAYTGSLLGALGTPRVP